MGAGLFAVGFYPLALLGLLIFLVTHFIALAVAVGAAVLRERGLFFGGTVALAALAIADFLGIRWRIWNFVAWSRVKGALVPIDLDGKPRLKRLATVYVVIFLTVVVAKYNTYVTMSDGWAGLSGLMTNPTSEIAYLDRALTSWRPAQGNDRKARWLSARGLAHAGLHRWEQARAQVEEAVTLAPRSAAAHMARGTLLYARGDLAAALSEYDVAVKLEPKNGYALMGRGYLLRQDKQWDRAIADLREAECSREAYQFCSAILANIGLVYADMGDKEHAESSYREAIAKIKPQQFLMGANSSRGEFVSALLVLDGNMALAPNEAVNYVARGYLNLRLERNEAALADARKAAALSPNDPMAADLLGIALFEMGDTKGALEACRRAVQAAPQEAGYRLDEALAERRLDQKDAALGSWRTACSLRKAFGESVEAAEREGYYYPPTSRHWFLNLLNEFGGKSV